MLPDPAKDELIRVLLMFRRTLLPWHESDLCFLHLDVFRYTCEFGSDEQYELMFDVLRVHTTRCGSCFRNILAESASTGDAFKRKVYSNLYVSALIAHMRRAGGVFEHKQEGGVHRVLMAYPKLLVDCPVARFEIVAHEDPTQENWMIADVLSEEIFNNPIAIARWLDEGVIPIMKLSLQRAAWGPAAWSELIGERPITTKIRWKGRVKTVAEGWHFRNRYQRLLDKYLDDDLRCEAETGTDLKSVSADAESALTLRDLVRRYDGRVPFGSFAKTTLQQRRIDRYRHRKSDALARSEALDDGSGADGTRAGYGRGAPAATQSGPNRGPTVDERDERIDLRLRMDRLRHELTSRESAIVDILSAHDLTDAEVAKRLGVARETITRDRASIRRKARRMFPPETR